MKNVKEWIEIKFTSLHSKPWHSKLSSYSNSMYKCMCDRKLNKKFRRIYQTGVGTGFLPIDVYVCV